jgi:hypothetical protein
MSILQLLLQRLYKLVNVSGTEHKDDVGRHLFNQREKLLLGAVTFIGDSDLPEYSFRRNAGDGLFACRIDIQENEAVKLRQGLCKSLCKVTRPGVEMRLEDTGEVSVGIHSSGRTDGGGKFGGVMRIVIDEDGTGGIETDVKTSSGTGEGGKSGTDLIGRNTVEKGESHSGDGIFDVDEKGHAQLEIIDLLGGCDEVKE